MFYLEIRKEDVLARNISNNQMCKAKYCIIRFKDQTIPLFSLKPHQLSHSLFGVDLTIHDYTSGSDEPNTITLHPVIAKRLLRFLMLLRPAKDKYNFYSCIDFVNELGYGRGIIPSATVNIHSGDGSKKNPEFHLNEFAAITDKEGKYVHFALSLGEDKFLSLFGSVGPLMVTSMNEMMKLFGGNACYKISPGESSNHSFFNESNLINLPQNVADKICSYLDNDDNESLKRATMP
ncbi:hypothetical protein EP47_14500 [Legionella norrlandica]|uniref:Uncharacterized protein n=1 Tax=Legionella norrlandica TaxID=1498499 RepID=A0A0A2SNZ2_9GAMM|nr:hypothetical protein [Legionella norrlandica]KGP62472.1 hypothetical protein EP47_14500 [Legionella norrlandica]